MLASIFPSLNAITSISCSDNRAPRLTKYFISLTIECYTISACSHIETVHQEADNANAPLNSVFKACHALAWPHSLLIANISFLLV